MGELCAARHRSVTDAQGQKTVRAAKKRRPSLRHGGRPRHALRARLERSIIEYQNSGTAASFGDWHSDVNAIAVGIRVGNSRGPMTINCGGPAFTLPREFLLEEVRPRLIELARRIETSLDQAAAAPERL
jgi:DNA-binding IclR family transcriptional regulator